jgi:hypothetical protein
MGLACHHHKAKPVMDLLTNMDPQVLVLLTAAHHLPLLPKPRPARKDPGLHQAINSKVLDILQVKVSVIRARYPYQGLRKGFGKSCKKLR